MNNLPAEKNWRVLVIDDNRAIHDDFRKILCPATATAEALDATEKALFGPSATALPHLQFEIDSAYQGEEGVLLAAKAIKAGRPYALAFVDVRMPPGWDGVETTGKLWELDPNLQVVICTAYSDYSWGEMFGELGQRDGLLILKKPFNSVEVFQLAHALTEKWWLHQQSRRKMAELESMVAGRTAELAHSFSLLHATFESTADGIVVVDLAGKVTSYNAKFTDIWQLPAEILARRDAAEIRAYAGEQAKNPTQFLRRTQQLNADPEAEGFDVIELKDGRTFERYVFPQRVGRECVGTVISWRDITERKRADEKLRESEDRYRLLVEESPDGIGIYQDAKLVFVNSTGMRLLGAQTQNEVLGRTNEQIIHPDDLPDAKDRVRRRLAGETGMYPAEVRYLRLDGTTIPVEVSAAPITFDGKPAMQFIARDITERKRAEEALQESQRHLRDLIDGLGPSMFVGLMTPQGILIECNRPALAAAGLKPEDVLGKPFEETYWWEYSPNIQAQLRATIARAAGGEASRYDVQVRVAENLLIDMDFSLQPVRDETGQVVFLVPSGSVITERKRAENALRESNEKFHQLADNITDAFWIRSPDLSEVHYLSPAFERIWGRTRASLYANPQAWAEFILPEDRERVQAAFAALAGDLPSLDIEYRIVRPNAEIRWVRVRGFQVRDAAAKLIRQTGIVTDITERKRVEMSVLAFSKLGQRLSSATTAREAFVIIKEVSQDLFGWDAFCVRLYSGQTDSFYAGFTVDTIQGQPVAVEKNEPVKPGLLYRRIIAQGGELILREHPPAFGSDMDAFGDVSRPSAALMFVPILSRGQVVGILSVQSYTPNAYNPEDLKTLQTMADQCGGAIERIWADDALRKAEIQLFQSQKLETVGKLAGGVAHEFNSLLTAIIGQSELILGDLTPGHPLAQNAAEISQAAERAAKLTRQLLAYGRRSFLQPESLVLNQVIASMEATIHHLLGGAVDVRIVPAAGLHTVKADAGQIEQVIMNLVMNAADAMPHGGKLTLETANLTLDPESVVPYLDLKPGDYVRLAITDTGAGMSETVKARAFEPFFTTKDVGQGTGLGLSTCYGIIKQSGGHISVYSELGRGTTFKIYLPQNAPQARQPILRLDSIDMPRGTETVLLVEDDPALREMAAILLRRLGYTVFPAANGVEALSVPHQRSTGHIDLLFTDVVMPHMSGTELADRVRALYPHTRILFTSAYTANAIIHQGVFHPGVALLQKPFTPSALAQKIREVLDQPAPPEPPPAPKGTQE